MAVAIPAASAIHAYLKIIEGAIVAYCEPGTPLIDRLYYAWRSVFLCRLWRAWLNTKAFEQLERTASTQFPVLVAALSPKCKAKASAPSAPKKSCKERFTITSPCFTSIEINAHSLTYLVLLAIESQVPFEALSIDLFASQMCENVFRSARAMSGVSSNIVNFTVLDFLRRVDKISTLQSIKVEHQLTSDLRFPKHHKHGKTSGSLPASTTAVNLASLQRADIDMVVEKAFQDARDLVKPFLREELLNRGQYQTKEALSTSIFSFFKTLKLRPQLSQQQPSTSSDIVQKGIMEEGENEEEDEEDDEGDEGEDESEESAEEDDENSDSVTSEEEDLSEVILDSSGASFEGMRVREAIDPSQSDSYFKVRRETDANDMYVHKQTASWILTNEKCFLSSDRLRRVTQAK